MTRKSTSNKVLPDRLKRVASRASVMMARVDPARPELVVAVASLFAWTIMTGVADGITIPGLCGGVPGDPRAIAGSLHIFLLLNPLDQLARHWLIMVVAMMGPVLCMTWLKPGGSDKASRSFAFIASYLAAWTASGVFFIPATAMVRIVFPASGQAIALAIALALAWQVTAIRRRCLSRCGEIVRQYPGEGVRAMRQGCDYARCCIAGCWPVMMLPSLAGSSHAIAMLGATAWILYERVVADRSWRGVPANAPRFRLYPTKVAHRNQS